MTTEDKLNFVIANFGSEIRDSMSSGELKCQINVCEAQLDLISKIVGDEHYPTTVSILDKIDNISDTKMRSVALSTYNEWQRLVNIQETMIKILQEKKLK